MLSWFLFFSSLLHATKNIPDISRHIAVCVIYSLLKQIKLTDTRLFMVIQLKKTYITVKYIR